MNRLYLFFVLIVTALPIYPSDLTADERRSVPRLSHYETIRLLNFTAHGTAGAFSLISTFALTGYAGSTMQDMESFADDIRNTGISQMTLFRNFTQVYPAIVFGANFLASGFAYIPVYGSIIYGTMMYQAAIAFCIMRIFDPIDYLWSSDIPANIGNTYRERLTSIHHEMFDPAPYFVIGSIAVIFGVLEIITDTLFRRELKKRKYPIMYKILSFRPDGIVIKLDV